SPERIKKDTFGRAVIELEAPMLREAADVLAETDAVEEVVRVGGRVRVIIAPGGPDADGVRRLLAARGCAVTWAREVEPSVEDLFVSFVDKERKVRVRDQLRALETDFRRAEAVGGVGEERGSLPPTLNNGE